MMTIQVLRWLLLRHFDNLDPERNEAQRLQEALELNRSLHIGYSSRKTSLRSGLREARHPPPSSLMTGADARATGIRVLQTMANTLQGYRTGILNWYDYPISSGPIEVVNNKIGALQRAAYAVQRSAILHHQTLCAPRGEIQIPCLNTCNIWRTVFDVEPEKGVYAATIWVLIKPGQISEICGISDLEDRRGVFHVAQRLFNGDIVLPEMAGTEQQVLARIYCSTDSPVRLKSLVSEVAGNVRVTGAAGDNLLLLKTLPQILDRN